MVLLAAGARVRRGAAARDRDAAPAAGDHATVASGAIGPPAVPAVPIARSGSAGRDDDAAGVQHRRDRLRDVLVRDAARRYRRRGCLPVRAGLAGDRARDRVCRSPRRSCRSTATPSSAPAVTAVPVFREASTSGPGGRVDIVGHRSRRPADPPRLAFRLLGDSRATSSPTRLHVDEPAGGWDVTGHRLPAGKPELDLRFHYTGEPLRLDAVVWTDEGDTVRIPLGTIDDGMTRASAPAAEERDRRPADRARLLQRPARRRLRPRASACIGRPSASTASTGSSMTRPIPLEIFTVDVDIIKAPQATDGLILPAVVSPDLARETKPDGTLDLHVGSGTIPIRVVGTADRAPTVVEPGSALRHRAARPVHRRARLGRARLRPSVRDVAERAGPAAPGRGPSRARQAAVPVRPGDGSLRSRRANRRAIR